jgi:hypothetical protein
MSDTEQPKCSSEADAELVREIREDRKFSLQEAIMRLAGPGMMKGESPVTRKRQAEAEIGGYLRRHLYDSSGALARVLFRHVANSELLVANLDQPLVVFAHYLQQVLDAEYMLSEVVREADVEWGRLLGERPHFEKEGSLPHAVDPYTIDSVRVTLSQLMEKLKAGDT